ncbi:MAG: hypothetical protein Fur005_28500 [Roseiflexaceae bacterium]
MRRLILRLSLVVALLLTFTNQAEAHPLGNFTINQYSRVTVSSSTVAVAYVVDMAEIPAFQTIQQIDSNGNKQVDPTEEQAFVSEQTRGLGQGLQLQINNVPIELKPISQKLSFPAGQGGLVTLRLELAFEGARPAQTETAQLSYQVSNFAERLGWREIVVQPGDGVRLVMSDALAATISNELLSYPADSLSSPLDMRSVSAELALGSGTNTATTTNPATGQASSRADDQLAALIATREMTPATAGLALLLAFLLGAGHALTPGHGKTVVAAYLVGSRGTAKHAIFLGLTTTITHTAGVFLLGFITLAVSQYILPEQLYPWLELISGLLVVAIGMALIRSRLHHFRQQRQRQQPDHQHGGWFDSDHEHGPDTHTHEYEGKLADWAAGNATTKPANIAAKPGVSWKSLLALGVSGGLIPCPSALVVLLGAIALGRVGFGMLLIVAFSAGLAAVLTALGMALVYARTFFEQLPTTGVLMRALPIASAILVTIAGCAISASALVQTGIL